MNITLDTDELGIWLIEETAIGPQQMGHVSWEVIVRGVQQVLRREQLMIEIAEMDRDLL